MDCQWHAPMDLQWHVPMDFPWHVPTCCMFSRWQFSKDCRFSKWTFIGIVCGNGFAWLVLFLC